jgi:hypothetical protein
MRKYRKQQLLLQKTKVKTAEKVPVCHSVPYYEIYFSDDTPVFKTAIYSQNIFIFSSLLKKLFWLNSCKKIFVNLLSISIFFPTFHDLITNFWKNNV